MRNLRQLWRIIVITSLITVNLFPILGFSSIAESGAPPINGSTTKTWYIDETDDITRNNEIIQTKAIQINTTGKMTWDNVTADIEGNITINGSAFFTLTDCILNLKGNLSINGTMNFDNVKLIMNSSYDGEYGIDVTQFGTFNILNNSNITAFDKTTSLDLYTDIKGNETWGLHYNFTVHGNLTMNNSYVSYTYGNPSYFGGIYLYEPAKAVITNSTIFENEVSAISGEGKITPIIRNNHIYNVSTFGIFLKEYASGIIDNNTIDTGLNNLGVGILCINYSDSIITRNTIKNNHYDGIYLRDFCNATIKNNIISNNNHAGIFLLGIVYSISGTTKDYTFNYPVIENNTITNNYEFGILDICCPMELINNTISQTRNQSGIWIQSMYFSSLNVPIGTPCYGNITDNTIQYNNHYGINISSIESINFRGVVTMNIMNNTITNNNWSGIRVLGGRDNNNVQRSPDPDIMLNNISNNNHFGVENIYALAYPLSYNYIYNNNKSGILCDSSSRPNINYNYNISDNGESGIICQSNSRPNIDYNYNISWNDEYGIRTTTNSRPRISYNNITHNMNSGIFMHTSTSSNQIYENTISNNQGHGIQTNNAVPNIYNNLLSNNAKSGIYAQGGTNIMIINNNDINYNFWSGIECNSSSTRIRNNNLTNNSHDGIKITRGAPTIDQENLVNYNSGNGLACYINAQPILIDSEYRFNGKNGIYLDNTDPQTTISTDINLITDNTLNGIMCVNRTGGRIKAKIKNNKQDGVFTANAGTNIEILNSNISNNAWNGINATANSAPTVSNSTITGNTGEAFWLDSSADPVALNTSFANTKVYYSDTASTFTMRWYIHIRTRDKATTQAVDNVHVWINSTTQSQVVWNGYSNIFGRIEWMKITEYVEKDSNGNHRGTDAGERTMWTPHDISGDKVEYRKTHVTPNPVIDHSQVIYLDLLPNNAPGKVSNIKPTSTHNPHPTIRWTATTDPDGHPIGYQVWVGTTFNTSDYFAHNSPLLTTTQFPLPVDLQYDSDGNKTYYITIVANDQHGGESYSPQILYLLNDAPTKPAIDLELSDAPSVNLQTITCRITTQSSDPDGDEINYTYRWYKNEDLQPLLTESDTKLTYDSISVNTDNIQFEKGDYWEVRVFATDGLGGIGEYANASFEIGNLKPLIASKINDTTLDEDTELIDEIDLTKAFTDPDQEVKTLKYIITVDDENLTVTMDKSTKKVSIKPASNWNGFAKVNFTCQDKEGLWVSQQIRVTVYPVNDEPKFKTIGGKPVTSGILEFVDDEAAIEETWFNLTVLATDVDIERGEDDEVSFSVSNESIEITESKTNPLMASLSFFPTNEDVGFFEFTIAVKDKSMKKYSQTIVIRIKIRDVNDPPELYSIKEYTSGDRYQVPTNRILDLTDDIILEEEVTIKFLVIAIDPDIDDELTFHTDAAKYVEVDPATGDPNTALVSVTPGKGSVGLFGFNVTVKDRKLESDTVKIIIEVKNVNDKPVVKIISPPEYDQIQRFEPGEEIEFEGSAEDDDIQYGDKLYYKWTSDKVKGELSYNLSFKINNLPIGEHAITFTAEDSFGESSSTIIHVIIGGIDKDGDTLPDDWEIAYFDSYMKYTSENDPDKDGYTNFEEYLGKSDPTDENDPDEQPRKVEEDIAFAGVIVAMIIIIIIVLIILFMFLRKMKKKKEEKAKVDEFGGEKPLFPQGELTATMGEDKTIFQQTTMPGVPLMPGQPGMPGLPPSFVPPQLTTCPNCKNIMTFSPDGGMFCIKCGFKQEKQ